MFNNFLRSAICKKEARFPRKVVAQCPISPETPARTSTRDHLHDLSADDLSAGWLLLGLVLGLTTFSTSRSQADEPRRLLYVAEPGIRNYLEYGGHGLLVFDIDHGHKFLKRIKTAGLDPKTGKPENVKGVCASARTGRIYVSTIRTLTCLDLKSEKILWEKAYEGGCDRMSISPDGSIIYLPSFEKDDWHVVDAEDGHVIARIAPRSGAHNTVYGLDGRRVYLAGLRSPILTVADTATHTAVQTVGPFSAAIRPFTVNGRQTLCFVNVNGLLGFEVGDLATGQEAAPGRGRRVRDRPGQASRLPEPRDRA